MERKIYSNLLEWKKNSIKTPLMIIGARQIGKTYIIKEFCQKEFEKNIYINLLDNPQIVDLFEQSIPTEEKFTKMQWILNTEIDLEKTIIFFDEIQLSEKLISNLKYFCESEKPFKIICAGSLLGVKINRFHSSFPVGKVEFLNMYPMTFTEFLKALTVFFAFLFPILPPPCRIMGSLVYQWLWACAGWAGIMRTAINKTIVYKSFFMYLFSLKTHCN